MNPRELREDPNNPRIYLKLLDKDEAELTDWERKIVEKLENDIDELVKTYEDHGIIDPIVVDQNNVVRRGHRRVRAAIKAGLEEVPTRRIVGVGDDSWFEKQLIDDGTRKDLAQIEKMWAYVTGVVNINTEQFHTIERVKEMNERDRAYLVNSLDISTSPGQGQRLGTAELSRRIGVNQRTICDYIELFKAGSGVWDVVETGRVKMHKVLIARRIQDEEVRQIVLDRVMTNPQLTVTEIREIKRLTDDDNVPRDLRVIIARGRPTSEVGVSRQDRTPEIETPGYEDIAVELTRVDSELRSLQQESLEPYSVSVTEQDDNDLFSEEIETEAESEVEVETEPTEIINIGFTFRRGLWNSFLDLAESLNEDIDELVPRIIEEWVRDSLE